MNDMLFSEEALDKSYNNAVAILPKEIIDDLKDTINHCINNGAISVVLYHFDMKYIIPIQTILTYYGYGYEINNLNTTENVCDFTINIL